MNQRYIAAKNAALGLEEGMPLPAAHNYEGVVIGQRAQTGVELFSKTFDTPPELIVRKSVLSLFDDYETDYGQAHAILENMIQTLRTGTPDDFESALSRHGVVEWFNCVFLEDEDIDRLILVLEKTAESKLDIFLAAIRRALDRLVNFKGLYSAVLKKWKKRGAAPDGMKEGANENA